MTIEYQYELFEKILKRELIEDERYLVRNAFLNGKEEGYKKALTETKAFIVNRR